ncbi:hypothetical protein C0Q70_06074 [Pomacea canaliculata]|uniref:HAT C-terminal dimerisation domain-containing protein n=1 Tax=Pomacea canaliculata TaxID=400727 RepID=A0A2T7PN63_POMCA|nr:hypothetical protein C0Q70_06074 [Pomacea canaliculata]
MAQIFTSCTCSKGIALYAVRRIYADLTSDLRRFRSSVRRSRSPQYIVFFQKREPVVHRLHDKQTELLKDFLACFVKPEALSAASDVTSIDLTDPDNIHMESMFTISSAANTLMKKQPKEVKKSIRLKMREAFVKCGTYLQEKMPVNNKVLKICSVLDPIMRNTTQARQLLGQIPSRTNLVQNDQDTVDRFHREVNKYTYDVSPSSASEDAPVDVWWGGVSQDRFPLLCAAAKALLSCFHGPIIIGQKRTTALSHFTKTGTPRAVSLARMRGETEAHDEINEKPADGLKHKNA